MSQNKPRNVSECHLLSCHQSPRFLSSCSVPSVLFLANHWRRTKRTKNLERRAQHRRRVNISPYKITTVSITPKNDAPCCTRYDQVEGTGEEKRTEDDEDENPCNRMDDVCQQRETCAILVGDADKMISDGGFAHGQDHHAGRNDGLGAKA